MTAIRAGSKHHAPLEDPLDYLPCPAIVEYRKGQVIYNQDAPSTSIYSIVVGRVKVSRLADGGRQVLVNIYQTNEFFGESAFVHLPQRPEVATALDNSKLMTWTVSMVQKLVLRQPRLGVAFVQMLAQRTTEFTQRIESLSADSVAQRLARCLIRLSERMGMPQEDGSVKMVHFTQELLAEDVGSSREIVSQYMNQFRKQGYVQYSRKGIVLYRALNEWLCHGSRERANVPAPGKPMQSPPKNGQL